MLGPCAVCTPPILAGTVTGSGRRAGIRRRPRCRLDGPGSRMRAASGSARERTARRRPPAGRRTPRWPGAAGRCVVVTVWLCVTPATTCALVSTCCGAKTKPGALDADGRSSARCPAPSAPGCGPRGIRGCSAPPGPAAARTGALGADPAEHLRERAAGAAAGGSRRTGVFAGRRHEPVHRPSTSELLTCLTTTGNGDVVSTEPIAQAISSIDRMLTAEPPMESSAVDDAPGHGRPHRGADRGGDELPDHGEADQQDDRYDVLLRLTADQGPGDARAELGAEHRAADEADEAEQANDKALPVSGDRERGGQHDQERSSTSPRTTSTVSASGPTWSGADGRLGRPGTASGRGGRGRRRRPRDAPSRRAASSRSMISAVKPQISIAPMRNAGPHAPGGYPQHQPVRRVGELRDGDPLHRCHLAGVDRARPRTGTRHQASTGTTGTRSAR